jgi:hypothetical protein
MLSNPKRLEMSNTPEYVRILEQNPIIRQPARRIVLLCNQIRFWTILALFLQILAREQPSNLGSNRFRMRAALFRMASRR